MSNYEWEHGTITLPAAAVPGLKKTLRDWTNALHDEVRAEAIRLHKEVAKSTRSHDRYQERLRAAQEAKWNAPERRQSYGWDARRQAADERRDMVFSLAMHVLDRMLWATKQAGEAPHQPTVADVNRIVEKKSNRDNVFPVFSQEGYSEASISFNGREVTWSVGENNHAVENAHATPIAGLFFTALGKIAWTRGTGGVLTGNNEYNRDARDSGGGANYITRTFGPKGDDERIFDYMRSGFSRKQAADLVAQSKRRAASPRITVGVGYGSRY